MTPNPIPPPPPLPPAQQPKKSNTSIFVILGVIAVGGCCFIGILAAIAVPNFIQFQKRSKQSECKTYLKTIYQAEKSVFAERDSYSDDLAELDFEPLGTRYGYLLGRSFVKPTLPTAEKEGLLEQTPAAIRQSVGATKTSFTAACVGNIDSDPALDVWTISSEPRVIDGESVPAGVPHNDISDVHL